MFEQQPLDQPQPDQNQPVGLGDGEGPGDPVHVVEELVRQRRAHRLVGYSLMDDGDDDGGEDEVEEGVEEGHAGLPPLAGQAVGRLRIGADLLVVAASLQLVVQRLDQHQAAQPAAPVITVEVVWGRRRR